jgi:hypothetical protein
MIKQVHYLHEQEHKQDEILRFLVWTGRRDEVRSLQRRQELTQRP